MTRKDLVGLMAAYNKRMNDSLIRAMQKLSHDELVIDKGAFSGSMLATLNHLMIADTIWLKRFACHPADHPALEPVRNLPYPDTKDLLRFPNLECAAAHREWLDFIIVEWARGLTEPALDFVLHYANSRGEIADKPLFGLIMHFFNHQTHHRGQITTLLSQAGVDIGTTDLLAVLPDCPA